MLVIKHHDGKYLSLWLESSNTPIWNESLHYSGRAMDKSVEADNMRKTLEKVRNVCREAYMAELPDDFRGPEEAARDEAMGPWVVEKMFDEVPHYLRVGEGDHRDTWMEHPALGTIFPCFSEANPHVSTTPGLKRVVSRSEAMEAYNRMIEEFKANEKDAPAPAPVANTVRLADDQFAALIAAIKEASSPQTESEPKPLTVTKWAILSDRGYYAGFSSMTHPTWAQNPIYANLYGAKYEAELDLGNLAVGTKTWVVEISVIICQPILDEKGNPA